MYRQILNTIALPVLLLDETCTIQFINQTFSEQFGHSLESLNSQPGDILFSDDSLSSIRQHVNYENPAATEITDRLTVHIKHRNGTWNIAIVSLHRLNLANQHYPTVLIQILSTENLDKGRTAEGLNKNIYRELLEQLPGTTYLCKNDSNYTILYIGEKILDMLGYSPDEFKENNVTLASLIDPDELSDIKKTVNIALEKREGFHLIYKMKHRNGHWVWMDETGKGIYNRKDELLFILGYYTTHTAAQN